MKVSLSCFIVRRDGWWNWLVGTIARAHHHHQRALFGHAKTSYFIYYYFARVFIYSLLAWDMMVLAFISVFLKRSLMVANCNRRSLLRRSASDLFVLLEMHFATAPDPRWGFLQLQSGFIRSAIAVLWVKILITRVMCAKNIYQTLRAAIRAEGDSFARTTKSIITRRIIIGHI